MASNKKFNFGPVYIANAAGNLLNPATAAGGVNGGSSSQFILLYHLQIVNKDTVSRTFTLYKGATGGSAGGTEIGGATKSIAANSTLDMYFSGGLRLDAADFLTGIADAASKLVVSGYGEVGVAG